MKSFDFVFNCMFLATLIYQVLYFLVQYAVLKRAELFYYSMFLLNLSVYYYVYVLSGILNMDLKSPLKAIFSSIQLSFQFSVDLLYLMFLTRYLELHKTKQPIYYLAKYYSYYNFFFFVVFVLLGLLKIESKALFSIVSLLTLPISLTMVIMLWRIKSTYANVVAYGTSCTVAGTLLSHLLIINGANTYSLYGGNAFVPVQTGLLLDMFILGYGLSLKAAASDKQLVKVLLENQEIVEVEQSRLAKDLHDGLGGLLSGIKLTLHSAADLVPEKNTADFLKATNQLEHAIKEMRRVAQNMMPEALLRFGLGEALQDYCDGINESNSIKMKCTQIGSLQTVSKSTEIIIYRIIQELTNNVLKHAAAKNIFVQVTQHERGITITVEDDGRGFVNTIADSKGAGLKNIQSKIDYLKGAWDIKTEIGNGTSVTIDIPGGAP